jgi:chorismate mutase
MRLVEEIGREKNQEGISIFQPARWNEIVEKMITRAAYHDLSEEFIFSLIEAIHIESIHHQSATMNRIQK